MQMASNNPVKTDPSTGAEAVPVYNHGQNVENAVCTSYILGRVVQR